MWMVFIKDIFSIVVRVKEGKGNGRFRLGKDVYVAHVNPILLQKTGDIAPNPVITRFTDKRARRARTRQRIMIALKVEPPG